MLVEKMNDGFSMIDENGVLTYVNNRFTELLGYAKEEVLGRPVTDFLHKANKKIFEREIYRRKKGQSTPYEIEWIRKDGEIIPTIISPTPVYDREGHFKGSFAVVTDITELKKTEKELQIYQARLRSLASELLFAEEKERRDIAADIHDSIAQDLAMAKLKLDAIGKSSLSPSFSGDLKEIQRLQSNAITQLRSLVFELSPPQLYELGLEDALETLIENIQRRYGIRLQFENDGQPKRMKEEVSVLLYKEYGSYF